MFTNMSLALELCHYLLSTVSLVKKIIKIFLRKNGQVFRVFINNKILNVTNIIENQYII